MTEPTGKIRVEAHVVLEDHDVSPPAGLILQNLGVGLEVSEVVLPRLEEAGLDRNCIYVPGVRGRHPRNGYIKIEVSPLVGENIAPRGRFREADYVGAGLM